MNRQRLVPQSVGFREVRVYRLDQAIELLKLGDVTQISLDHDLGDDDRDTGITWCLENPESKLAPVLRWPVLPAN